MKISLAMTTYNGEKFILQQLNSILKQSVLPDEVIICDDKSTDRTEEIITAFIKKNNLENYWHYYRNVQNKGYANNFYDAARMCSGDIIIFADQDDVWRLNKIEIMKSVFEKNQNIGVLYGKYRDYDTNKEQPEPSFTDFDQINPVSLSFNRHSMYLRTIGCVMAVRSEFLTEIEKYWYNGFAHDEYVWKIGLCKNRLYHINVTLIDRRCHGNNVSKKKMRNLAKRIDYVSELKKSYHAMSACLKDEGKENSKESKLVLHNINGCNLRLEVMKGKKLWLLPVLLIHYPDTVMTIRSFFVEAYYAVKGKIND